MTSPKLHVVDNFKLVQVQLPYPPFDLNPNKKNDVHWGKYNGIKEKYKRDCWITTLERVGTACIMPAGDIPLKLVFYYKATRPDTDNLLAAAKYGIDGMASALKINDNVFDPLIVTRLPVETSAFAAGGPCLVAEFPCQVSVKRRA